MMPNRILFIILATQWLLSPAGAIGGGTVQPDIQPLLKQLAADSNQPSLWRRLGKLRLDAGEFAEARRIFCLGSSCCPSDEQLKHHVRVFQAFHPHKSSSDQEETKPTSKPIDHPPLLGEQKDLFSSRNTDSLFLSLNVPSQVIPDSILQHPSSSLASPHERVRLIHASKEPIIPKDACQFLINEALKSTEQIGWTKDRHVQAPTCDVPVFDLAPAAQEWVRDAFDEVLFPLLCRVVAPDLNIEPSDLRVQDCFIVRYDAEENESPGFSSLKPHQDESLLSLTIALNQMDEDYEDGGLFIAPTQDLLNGPAGTVLCFAGGLIHGGYPVSRGTRWILTVFLYIDSNQSGRKPGYTLKALEELALQLKTTKQEPTS